jgi:transposase-like protein
MFEQVDHLFPTEEACISHLERIRWNGIVTSPFRPTSRVYVCGNGKYKCRDSGKYFSVKTGTIFHNSRISLRNWFRAIWIMSVEKRPVTSVNMAKSLGITQKTAWYMMQKIRAHFGLKKTFPKQSHAFERELAQQAAFSEKERLTMSDWLNTFKNG